MKKTIIALMAMGSVAFGVTPTTVEEAITLDGTQPEDARLDMKYSTNPKQTITTSVDDVTIHGTDGYGLSTSDVTLTFDIKNTLTATSAIKLVSSGTTSKVEVKTTISDAELATLDAGNNASRWVVTADHFADIRDYVTNGNINLTLNGLTGYSSGGLIFDLNGSYYAASDITFTSSTHVQLNENATALALTDGNVYTTLKIIASSSASVKGIGFVATTPAVPEPTTATLSLLALAGLAARRRRK